MARKKDTLIRITIPTHERLKKIAKYGNSMDSVIKKLLDHYEKKFESN